MPDPSPGENLLFAILAFKADLIDGEQLNEALRQWGTDQARSMAEILRDLGALDDEAQAAVRVLMKKHLAKHGNDAAASLRGLSPIALLRIDLPPIADPQLRESLQRLVPAAALTPFPASIPPVKRDAVRGLRFINKVFHAQGGLGRVFRAEDTELHREVALKEIRADAHPDQPDTQARFLREGEITGRLEHPGIVPVYSLGTYADGRPFYAMRFIRGENLGEAIQRFHTDNKDRGAEQQGLALRRLLERFLDACNAVAYAHSRGVLHRDLKPGNIMLGPFGETLVVDWGLARVAGISEETRSTEGTLAPQGGSDYTPTQTGVAIGTPQYMPPEQASGQLSQMGPASDVYSLGATLYELLTGRPPFPRPSEVGLDRLLESVRQGNFPRPAEINANVPPPLEAICLRAMAQQPGNRYASARDLIEAIENWLLGREQAKARALAQVEALREAGPLAVPLLLKELEPCREDVESRLRDLWALPDLPDRQRLRVGLALLPIAADGVRERLVEFMLDAEEPQEVVLVRDGLSPFSAGLAAGLWSRLAKTEGDAGRRFRILIALTAFDPGSDRWPGSAGQAVEQLLAANPLHVAVWKQALEPVRAALLGPLVAAFRAGQGTDRGLLAATILADYAHDQPAVLAALVPDADERQHRVLLPRWREHQENVSASLRQDLARSVPIAASDAEHDALAQRQATAAVTLLHLGDEKPVWPLLLHSEDPSRRSYLLHHLAAYGIDGRTLLRRLAEESDVSARRALLLALGEYPPDRFPAAERQPLVGWLLSTYRGDPDPGIHGAVEWLLRRWGQAEDLGRLVEKRRGQAPDGRRWYVNGQGQTFTIIPGPVEFLMGSPETEPDRDADETQHRKRIPRSFVIATRQVTVAQFRRFLAAHPEVKHNYTERYSSDDDGPIISVTWFEAAQFCNWLSEEEGIPPEQRCYPPIKQIKEGMSMPSAFLQRAGYRLPTEAEWEYACRAGATTSRFYGRTDRLLGKYAWYLQTSKDRAWPCGLLKPNDLGLFDTFGNVLEWCQDPAFYYSPAEGGQASLDGEHKEDIEDRISRVLRGGSFNDPAATVRSADRTYIRPSNRFDLVGLRLAGTFG